MITTCMPERPGLVKVKLNGRQDLSACSNFAVKFGHPDCDRHQPLCLDVLHRFRQDAQDVSWLETYNLPTPGFIYVCHGAGIRQLLMLFPGLLSRSRSTDSAVSAWSAVSVCDTLAF